MKTILFVLSLVALLNGSLRAGIDTTVTRVLVPSGDFLLDGLLIQPKATANPAPAIIWLGGSGAWEMITNYPNEPDIFYRYYLEPRLLAEGFAILYLNKRGMGRSTGRWQKQNFDSRADDANAAHRYLSSLPRIDARRIGMVGHSQGGWIAQLAASQNRAVAFSVTLCGPTIDVVTQTMHTYQRLYECQGASGKRLARKLRWKKRELAAGGFLGRFFRKGEAGQWVRIRRYNHDAVLKTLKSPSLMVFGERDLYVWPDANLNHLKSLFPSGLPTTLQTHVEPGAEHMLHVVPDRCIYQWEELKKHPYSETLQNRLAIWIVDASAQNRTEDEPK